MKALTVKQPWAWSILYAGKTVENRLVDWKYRGPLAIHAGLRLAGDDAPVWEMPHYRAALAAVPAAVRHRLDVRGAVLGVVDLVDVHLAAIRLSDLKPCCDSPWAEPQDGTIRVTHLVLENPRPLEVPVPWKGSLGLWNLPDEVMR